MISKDGNGIEYTFEKPRKDHEVPILSIKNKNGHQLDYQYGPNKTVRSIKAKNRLGEITDGLQFRNMLNISHLRVLEAISLQGDKASYSLSKHKKKWLLDKVESTQHPTINYYYNDQGFLIRKEEPNSRDLEIDYHPLKPIVKQLRAPVGSSDTPIPIYNFNYYKGKRENKGRLKNAFEKIKVLDAYNHLTTYYCNEEERLSKIEHYSGCKNHKLHSQELFYWGAPQTPLAGNLISRVLTNAQGQALLCKNYDYDTHGNVLAEYLYGNLTKQTLKTYY